MNGRGGICQHLHVADLGDVCGATSCGASRATQLLGAGFGPLDVAGNNEHLATVLTEALGDPLADAFAGPGDNHGPACNRCQHDSPPTFRPCAGTFLEGAGVYHHPLTETGYPLRGQRVKHRTLRSLPQQVSRRLTAFCLFPPPFCRRVPPPLWTPLAASTLP